MKTRFFANTILTIISFNAGAEVDLISGGYVQRIDVTIGRSPVAMRLLFRSRSTWVTNLGYGWCGPWSAILTPKGNQTYSLEDCNSRETFYPRLSPSGSGVHLKSQQGSELRQDVQGQWAFKFGGERLKFDREGRLTERWSGEIGETFTYDALNRLKIWASPWGDVRFRYRGMSLQASALELDGESILLRHQGEDLIQIRTKDQSFAFEYDDVHNLTVVRRPGEIESRIRYDSINDRVKEVVDSRNCSTRFDYAFPAPELQQFIKWRSCAGESPVKSRSTLKLMREADQIRISRLVREIRGEEFEYVFNNRQRLTEVRNSQRGSLTFQYDEFGNFIRIAGIESESLRLETLSLALEAL